MIYLAAGTIFAALWLAFLISGSALIGGSPGKLIFVKRRTNPAGYAAAMVLLAAVIALCGFEGLAELERLPTLEWLPTP